jgi:hypothetical protein
MEEQSKPKAYRGKVRIKTKVDKIENRKLQRKPMTSIAGSLENWQTFCWIEKNSVKSVTFLSKRVL